MGFSKGLLLGSAAGLLMATGSSFAADLPSRKAAPVAYVKICDVYGRGFYYIPGTNTCLKVGGRVRFELGWHRAQNTWIQAANARAAFPANPATAGVGIATPLATYAANIAVIPGVLAVANVAGGFNFAGGAFTNGARQDTLGWRTRAYINMDARTQTAWGTVQTVFSVALRNRTGIFNGNIPGAAAGSGVNLQVYAAYIRFAGFTVGRAPWVFASGPGHLFYWTNHSGGAAPGQMQLAYTATFGGGFSATIALVDKDNDGRLRNTGSTFSNVFADGLAGVPGVFNLTWAGTAPNRTPQAVLSLRLDQGWGYVQVSGAVGRNHAVFGNGNGFIGTPMRTINKTGWAVGAAAKINLPSLARGDALYFYVAYANGLLDMINSNNINGSIAKDGRISGGYLATHNNFNVYACGSFAGVITSVCSQNTKAFVAMAAFTHYWTPTLRSNFAVSYASMSPGRAAQNVDWFIFGGQPKSNAWQASGNLIWSPTRGFDIGLELYYSKITHKLACGTGSVVVVGYVCTPWGTPGTGTVGVAQNPNDWAVKLRVQRTF